MPIYEYQCSPCHLKFELMRPMGQSDSPAPCPRCQQPARRLMSLFASFSRSGGGEATPISGAGPSCSACSSTNCSTCG